jgi:hypothetical protein
VIDGPTISDYLIWSPVSSAEACGTKGASLRPNFHWEQEQRRNGTVSTTAMLRATRRPASVRVRKPFTDEDSPDILPGDL